MAVMKSWCRLERVGKPFLLVRNTLVGKMIAFTGSPTHRSSTLWAGRSAVISSTTERLPYGDGMGRFATKRSHVRYKTVAWSLRKD